MTQKKKSNRDAWIDSIAWDVGHFLAAFMLMFALALVHKDIHGVPAIGYWASVGLVWATGIIGSFWRGMPKDTK